jgi:hypothetical protein
MIRTNGLGGHDALRARLTREALRPSERVYVRTCVAGAGRRDSESGGRKGGQTLNIPLGRVLQAAIGTVVDGFAKAFGHFSVYRHDGGSHDRCK